MNSYVFGNNRSLGSIPEGILVEEVETDKIRFQEVGYQCVYAVGCLMQKALITGRILSP